MAWGQQIVSLGQVRQPVNWPATCTKPMEKSSPAAGHSPIHSDGSDSTATTSIRAPTEHYVRARAYSPTLTRWLSRDPLLAAESAVLLAGSPPFVNCNNSPLSCIDPTGLFFYTPAIDIAYCKAKLARISQIWTRTHPCAGELLAQFLSPPRVTDPCPESCKAVLTGHGLGFVSDCIKAHLAGLMPGCGQKGDLTFNVAGSHTFQGAPWLQGAAGTNQELHWALNYAVWSADVDCSYLCAQGIVTSAQCCCDCNVSCGWTVKVEDRYDFCTTASNVWREPTWCACLLRETECWETIRR